MVCTLIILLLISTTAYAEPFIEVRYALFSNKPSVIGEVECPCYASEIIAGYEGKWNRLSVEFTNSWIYHTRWDDPEAMKTSLRAGYRINSSWQGLVGYEISHNIDRAARIPYQSQIEWNGVKEIQVKDDYYGLSGLHYLWVGVRYTLR